MRTLCNRRISRFLAGDWRSQVVYVRAIIISDQPPSPEFFTSRPSKLKIPKIRVLEVYLIGFIGSKSDNKVCAMRYACDIGQAHWRSANLADLHSRMQVNAGEIKFMRSAVITLHVLEPVSFSSRRFELT